MFTEFIGATEFPSDPGPYLNVTGNPGCYNDTDLPTKPTINSKQNRKIEIKGCHVFLYLGCSYRGVFY